MEIKLKKIVDYLRTATSSCKIMVKVQQRFTIDFTFKTDRIQLCHEGQVLLVFCGLNRRKVLISLIENSASQLCDLICLICTF